MARTLWYRCRECGIFYYIDPTRGKLGKDQTLKSYLAHMSSVHGQQNLVVMPRSDD